jgi:hypothetical protein
VAHVELESFTLAGAFLLGAALATLATLRVMRAVTDFLTGSERRRLRDRRLSDDEEEEP